jgi:alanine racemase
MNLSSKRLYAEIDLDAAEQNFRRISAIIDPPSKICCVVKANAYGHDDIALGRLYEELGADFFAVSNILEAEKLRQGVKHSDILILGWTHPDCVPELLACGFIQTVTGLEHAKSLAERLPEGETLRVHIKIDTGMGRLGIKFSDFGAALEEIKAIAALPGISAEGIFTHFASADGIDNDSIDFTTAQKECFFYLCDRLERDGITFTHRHCFNSAGTMMHYDNRSTLERVGISLYGLKPDIAMPQPFSLTPVMSLYSVVSQIKTIKQGESVSYGRTYTAKSEMKTAVIPVGYADGYPRALSNKGYMLINGQKAGILGRVCMDQTVVDITDIPGVSVGDRVVVIGKSGEESITADTLAALAGTIGYEITCGIGLRVPRYVRRGGEIVSVSDYYTGL